MNTQAAPDSNHDTNLDQLVRRLRNLASGGTGASAQAMREAAEALDCRLPTPACQGCDPADGFCKVCRDKERQASVLPASVGEQALTKEQIEDTIEAINTSMNPAAGFFFPRGWNVLLNKLQGMLSEYSGAAPSVKIPGLGRITNEDDGYLTLQFKDEDTAQAFMKKLSPSVDVRDMPPMRDSAPSEQQAAPEQACPCPNMQIENHDDGTASCFGKCPAAAPAGKAAAEPKGGA